VKHAAVIAGAALLAVFGESTDLSDDRRIVRDAADQFWSIVLPAVRDAQ
jgi:hypothetical protein